MQNDRAKFKNEFKKRLYQFVLRLINFIDGLPKDSLCRITSDQLLRSSTSILANFVEAQSASSKRDFTNFFHHALKSANESKVWLALLRDSKRGEATKIENLLKELVEISNILASSILTPKEKR